MQVKVDELLNIFHFHHNVDLNYTFKFSTFKYYSSIHQIYNEKVGVNSFLTNHFQTYLLSNFIVQKFFKIYNHVTINPKKSTMPLLS
jgi:hypothetical protein